jgi:26S proteasome regulatory subunit N2
VHDDVLADSPREDADMLQDDHRMEDVVNRMFARCIEEKNYKQVFSSHRPSDVQALGVAIEARRSDVIVRILEASQDSNLLDYLLTISMEYIRNIKWRNEVPHNHDSP